MSKFFCGLALVALLGLSLLPASANAAGTITVYFDPAGTVRGALSSGTGQLQTLFVYGDGFGTNFVSGLQYAIDYGPDLNFIADIGTPPVTIGTSAAGISIGFGASPRAGKFLIHIAIATWANDCAGSFNNHITVGPHPGFPEPTPIVTQFPGQDVAEAIGQVSQTCHLVEMDIKPGSCPNPFNVNRWAFADEAEEKKGGVLPVAILGSASFDVNNIDTSSLLLEGTPPTKINDVQDEASSDGVAGCCEFSTEGDGYGDLLIKFSSVELASNIPPALVGATVELTLTGALLDGTVFEATDCIKIVGNSVGNVKLGGNDNSAGLGDPTPNPFNPVNRISYNVPASQTVRIAVYDVAGRLVEQLVNETKAAGQYVVEWDAGTLPSGVYFYRMQIGKETFVRRAVLLK